MSGRARSGLVLASVLALLSCEDTRLPLDLDAVAEPEGSCVTVMHETLELDGPVHQFIGDGGSSPGGWALITSPTFDDELVIVRVPASSDEAPTPVVELGLPHDAAGEISLRAGADSGELWALSRAGIVRLRRVLPELGEVARNDSLSNFPIVDGGGGDCPSDHERLLLLSQGRPYVLALPDCSDDQSLNLHLLALERETLEFETSWQLAFDPCAGYEDPVACAVAHAYRLAEVRLAGASTLTNLERVPVGFVRVREFTTLTHPLTGSAVRTSDVSLLDMRLTPEGPQARLLTFPEVWRQGTPIVLGPVGVTQDPYSTQLFVRNLLFDDDAALMRFDTISDLYIQLTSPELLPHAGHGVLAQLASQGVIFDVVGGRLEAVPLIDIDSWPWWTSVTVLELDGLIAVEPAGVGLLLLRRENAPPQVVHVSCL